MWCTCSRGPSLSLVHGGCYLGCPQDALLLCRMVPLKFSLGPSLCASSWPRSGFDAVGTWAANPSVHSPTASGGGQWGSFCFPLHYSGQWVVVLLQYTVSLPGGSGQWLFFCALPRCIGAVGNGTPSVLCLTALGQWAVVPLPYSASLPRGSG